MNIPQKIDEILAQRKKLLPNISAAIDRVKKARRAIDRLESYRSNETDLPPELMRQLAGIMTSPFYEKETAVIYQLEQLQKRFSRDEISICLVGRARQGKSLLLQQISGLDNDVIPSSDGSFCTGTRSIITNFPNSDTVAEIDFYTEREYVDIVNVYIDDIFGPEAPHISSIKEISGLKAKLKQVPHNKPTSVEILTRYLDHAADFQGSFGSHITVPKHEIELYVAQYSHTDKNKRFYTYLGVKQANIHASFPCEQCGRIVLVDTIGTGDTSLGVEESMLDTARDSDAIVMMFRPDAMADVVYNEEYQQVMSIAHAVTPEYTKKMMFWLLNRVERIDKGPNASRIPTIISELKGYDFPVADYLNVDCSNREDVERKMLIPLLEHMSQNLSDIDSLILDRVNKLLRELEQAYHAISSKMEKAMGASVNMDERRHFASNIERKIGLVTNTLRDLFIEQEENKDIPSSPVSAAFEQKLNNISRFSPSQEAIMGWLNDGTITKLDAIGKLSNGLRLQIINDFLELNVPLHNLTLEMKKRVVQVLADQSCGNLGPVVNMELDDPEAWLIALRNKLDEAQFPLLRYALKILNDFDLRMENFLIYRVRRCLRPIDWDINKHAPDLASGFNDKEALANEIRAILDSALWDIRSDIQEEISGFESFPNTAIFAVLHDFHDRVAYAGNDDTKDVKTEWRYLYEDKIPLVWLEEHKAYSIAAGRAEEWTSLTEEISSYTSEGYFLIK